MSKQKNSKQQNRINPEKYIRERARNLPIYKCWINKGWSRVQSATIFVSRKHASGNVTFGIYMLDLLCKGVKETLFKYNISEEELMDLIESGAQNHFKFKEISYNLAHNIIYASIEYADEYGFSPDADFTRVTQYLLEEDDEKIPLIDIHCGDENGQPIYINLNEDTPAQEKQIIAQLEKTAGPGNYSFISNDDDDDDDDDDDEYDDYDEYDEYDDDDYDEYDDEYDEYEYDDDDDDDDKYRLSKKMQQIKDELRLFDDDKLKARYFESLDNFESHKIRGLQNLEYSLEFVAAVDVSLERIGNARRFSKHFVKYIESFNVETVDLFDLPNSALNLQYDDTEKLENLYDEVVDGLQSDNRDELMEKFRKEVGDIPYIYYMELSYSDLSDDEYDRKLNEYAKKYPDYLLFKINKYARDTKLHKKFKTLLSKVKGPITEIEFVEYLRCYTIYCLETDNIDVNELIAFDLLVKYYNNKGFSLDNLIAYLMIVKSGYVRRYYVSST
jgi:hypothetical protein